MGPSHTSPCPHSRFPKSPSQARPQRSPCKPPTPIYWGPCSRLNPQVCSQSHSHLGVHVGSPRLLASSSLKLGSTSCQTDLPGKVQPKE